MFPLLYEYIRLNFMSQLMTFSLFRYHRQQNKCYSQRCQIVRKTAALCNEILTAVTNLLLWASKFATVKIKCGFEMGKQTHLGVPFILLAMVLANAHPLGVPFILLAMVLANAPPLVTNLDNVGVCSRQTVHHAQQGPTVEHRTALAPGGPHPQSGQQEGEGLVGRPRQ